MNWTVGSQLHSRASLDFVFQVFKVIPTKQIFLLGKNSKTMPWRRWVPEEAERVIPVNFSHKFYGYQALKYRWEILYLMLHFNFSLSETDCIWTVYCSSMEALKFFYMQLHRNIFEFLKLELIVETKYKSIFLLLIGNIAKDVCVRGLNIINTKALCFRWHEQTQKSVFPSLLSLAARP